MWLKLTDLNGEIFIANMDRINGIVVVDDKTLLCNDYATIAIKESIEEIEHLIRDGENA